MTNDTIFQSRTLGQIGLDLYFYNLRTLMIYRYEILYQLTEGNWSSGRYFQGHSEPWVNANLHLTSGKSNARNMVEIGCDIPKNDYNLKKILNAQTAYARIRTIGKLVNSMGDESVDQIKQLLDYGFHEYGETIPEQYSEEMYESLMNDLKYNSGVGRLYDILTPEIIEAYCLAEYSDSDLRDDLGMIQNTMRNTMTLQY